MKIRKKFRVARRLRTERAERASMKEGEGPGGGPQDQMYVFAMRQNLDFIQTTVGNSGRVLI